MRKEWVLKFTVEIKMNKAFHICRTGIRFDKYVICLVRLNTLVRLVVRLNAIAVLRIRRKIKYYHRKLPFIHSAIYSSYPMFESQQSFEIMIVIQWSCQQGRNFGTASNDKHTTTYGKVHAVPFDMFAM